MNLEDLEEVIGGSHEETPGFPQDDLSWTNLPISNSSKRGSMHLDSRFFQVGIGSRPGVHPPYLIVELQRAFLPADQSVLATQHRRNCRLFFVLRNRFQGLCLKASKGVKDLEVKTE